MPDVLDIGFRKQIITDIDSDENRQRKKESLRRFEVYKDRQEEFVIEKLRGEFNQTTIKDMRKVLSINMCKRVVNEQSTIYNKEPNRTFSDASDNEKDQLMALYEEANVNLKLRKTNRWFKLFGQTILQVIPRRGIVDLRCYAPHQIDKIDDDLDPELAFGYIINVMDKSEFLHRESSNRGKVDNFDQTIGDADDYMKKRQRFVWWTDQFNFVTDGEAKIIGDETQIVNPLGKLPFIDVASEMEKDFEFWIRSGSSECEFSLEMSVMLSDLSNIIKLQGYAQAIVTGEELPENIVVGPNHILRLPISSTTQIAPSFEFASPNADINGSIDAIEMYVRFFLTSRGLDPKTVSGKAEDSRFSSGIERLLSMIDRFEASRQDFDIFSQVEQKIFNLMRGWSNLMQNTDALNEDLKGGQISDNVELEVMFSSPEVIKTQSESEESVIRRMREGLMTKVEAIAELRNMDEDNAREVLEKINEENANAASNILRSFDNGSQGETEDQSDGNTGHLVSEQRRPEDTSRSRDNRENQRTN